MYVSNGGTGTLRGFALCLLVEYCYLCPIQAKDIMPNKYGELWKRLATIYGESEAKAIARRVFETRFGLSLADIYCGKADCLAGNEVEKLELMADRLVKGEPVQYVLGVETFGGRDFNVAPGVLIPRPETEELCSLIAKEWGSRTVSKADGKQLSHPTDILDIGTGSGCIAVTLALDVENAAVTAWDISPKALDVAHGNAQSLGASVTFEERDALHLPHDTERWDIIVSNPPYICDKEKADMERNVLDHEPHLALFVPDDNPLLFYRAIAEYGAAALKPGGQLWFEVNAAYAEDTSRMLKEVGYEETSILTDCFGRQRFVRAMKSCLRTDVEV